MISLIQTLQFTDKVIDLMILFTVHSQVSHVDVTVHTQSQEQQTALQRVHEAPDKIESNGGAARTAEASNTIVENKPAHHGKEESKDQGQKSNAIALAN